MNHGRPLAHIPVLPDEVMQALDLAGREVVVDATWGRGGHAREMLKRLPASARLIVIDRDAEAVAHARNFSRWDTRIEVAHSPFSNLRNILWHKNLVGKVNAILFDLGVSSVQLDQPERGFSFHQDGPLDMRMDQSAGVPAAEWLKQVGEDELAQVLRRFGEEKFSRRIARNIKRALLSGDIKTTGELAGLVVDAVPFRERRKHPATRTFQAIRIALNQELRELQSALPQALEVLAPDGRLVVISFHSLEDRIVKRFLRAQSKGDPWPASLPVTSDMLKPGLSPVGKPVRATADELARNPRARSAALRVARKLATDTLSPGMGA